MEEKWLLLIFVVVALILPRIPVVGKFFNIINTALHELGHALMALLTGGEVRKIELFNDTSGTTTTVSKNKFASVLVSLAGYPFAAFSCSSISFGRPFIILTKTVTCHWFSAPCFFPFTCHISAFPKKSNISASFRKSRKAAHAPGWTLWYLQWQPPTSSVPAGLSYTPSRHPPWKAL